MIPRARIEALTDGIFAFAMTLLVTGLVFPDGFSPASSQDLLDAILDLDGQLIAYIISFFVLALRWMGQARDKGDPKVAGGLYLWAVLIHLFTITTLPFSTMLIGRYEYFAPAVWVYAANMSLSALAAIAISYTAERATGIHQNDSGRVELLVLVFSALLSVVISLFNTEGAMYAYFLNFAAPFFHRILPQRLRQSLD